MVTSQVRKMYHGGLPVVSALLLSAIYAMCKYAAIPMNVIATKNIITVVKQS